MDKNEKEAFINSKIQALEKAIVALQTIKDTPRSETAILNELNLNKSAFRKIVYGTKWEDGFTEERVSFDSAHLPTTSWTEDLFIDVANLPDTPFSLEKIPSDIDTTIPKALEELSDRDKQFVLLYYKEKLSYTDISYKLEVSVERVRQIHGRIIKFLRDPNRFSYIDIGDGYYMSKKNLHKQLEQDFFVRIRKSEVDRLNKILYAQHEELSGRDNRLKKLKKLGLSQRSERLLYENGVRTLGDLCLFTEKDVKAIYGLGARSLDEIKAVLKENHVWFAVEEETNK